MFRWRHLVHPPLNLVHPLIQAHFRPLPLDRLSLTERRFPHRVRADLQRAVDGLLGGRMEVLGSYGLFKHYNNEGIDFAELLILSGHDPAQAVPPLHEEIDIGEDRPVRCLKNGLWLLESDGTRLAVLLERYAPYGQVQGMRFQVAAPNDPAGAGVVHRFFEDLEEAVKQAGSYRGKVLSLEAREMYSGESSGITVHRLKPVERDQVILPAQTLELLERNVIRFVGLRLRLNGLGLATKKGLLFYGPPGTGKTHTIHYLAGALPGHTTLLITAEQVGLLDEYIALARLLQPSIVVIEDVDLIARDRTTMDSPCEEVLLNKLLNEMDGLRPDSEILFVLTTNRPEALEAALASRPGRVDQAIEFPLPDEEGRTKLVRLYARGMEVPEEVLRATVLRTEGVSASFIKELMRRSAQCHLERDGEEALALADVEAALDELLLRGGSLNRKLLGGGGGQWRLLHPVVWGGGLKARPRSGVGDLCLMPRETRQSSYREESMARSHRTTASPLPVTNALPSGANASERTSPISPLSTARTRPNFRSQSFTSLLRDRPESRRLKPTARVRPSGENETQSTPSPDSAPMVVRTNPVAMSKTLAVRPPPEANHFPSGENDTESAIPSCLKATRSRPDATSKSRTIP
jgi:hypothetical protein